MTEPQSRRSWVTAALTAGAVLTLSGTAAVLFPPSRHTAPVARASERTLPSAPPPSPFLIRTATTTRPVKATSATSPDSTAPAAPRKPVFQRFTPTPMSYQEGVEADELCRPSGAVGHTDDGTLMICTPRSPDTENRWHRVIPPPPLHN